jgi:hypothetical protein
MNDTMLIKADRVIGENTVGTTVSSTVTLTRPATRIVDITGQIEDLTVSVLADQVQIQGILHKQVFYVGPEERVYHQAENVPFGVFVNIPGAEPGMVAQVHPRVVGITRTLEDSRTLKQQATLQFFVKVTEDQQLNAVLASTGSLYKVRRVVGENTIATVVETATELPTPAMKIRDIVANLRGVSSEVLTDQVVVRGSVIKEIFYVGPDGVERFFREVVPFVTTAQIMGARPGMDAQVHARIERVDREMGTERIVRQRVVLSIFIKVAEIVQVRLATSTTGPLIKVNRVVAENTKQVMLESTECLTLPALKIRNIDARVTDVNYEVIDNKVIIQGTLHKQIFFVGPDDLVHHQREDVPFSTFVEIAGARVGMNAQVHPRVEFVSWTLLPYSEAPCSPIHGEPAISDLYRRGVHQKVVVDFFVKVTEEAQIHLQVSSGAMVAG